METIDSYTKQQLLLAAEVARSGDIPLDKLIESLEEIYEENIYGSTENL